MMSLVHTSCSGIPFIGATTFLTKVVLSNDSSLYMTKIPVDEDECHFFQFTNEFKETVKLDLSQWVIILFI